MRINVVQLVLTQIGTASGGSWRDGIFFPKLESLFILQMSVLYCP